METIKVPVSLKYVDRNGMTKCSSGPEKGCGHDYSMSFAITSFLSGAEGSGSRFLGRYAMLNTVIGMAEPLLKISGKQNLIGYAYHSLYPQFDKGALGFYSKNIIEENRVKEIFESSIKGSFEMMKYVDNDIIQFEMKQSEFVLDWAKPTKTV